MAFSPLGHITVPPKGRKAPRPFGPLLCLKASLSRCSFLRSPLTAREKKAAIYAQRAESQRAFGPLYRSESPRRGESQRAFGPLLCLKAKGPSGRFAPLRGNCKETPLWAPPFLRSPLVLSCVAPLAPLGPSGLSDREADDARRPSGPLRAAIYAQRAESRQRSQW